MNSIVFFAWILVLTISTQAAPLSSASSAVDCSDPINQVTLHINTRNCSTYLQCVHGSLLERPCAPGTVFGPAYGVCVHPYQSDCVEVPDDEPVVPDDDDDEEPSVPDDDDDEPDVPDVTTTPAPEADDDSVETTTAAPEDDEEIVETTTSAAEIETTTAPSSQEDEEDDVVTSTTEIDAETTAAPEEETGSTTVAPELEPTTPEEGEEASPESPVEPEEEEEEEGSSPESEEEEESSPESPVEPEDEFSDLLAPRQICLKKQSLPLFLYKYQQDCKKYILCTFGKSWVLNCGAKEYFNSTKKVCERNFGQCK